MELVEKMETVSHEVQGVLQVLNEIDAISKQTSLLPLNATNRAAPASKGASRVMSKAGKADDDECKEF
jgi:methyl-accepting chemotaxis protein